ncbi:hypothetical protein [Cellulomonas fimi]|uniref:Lipoprotein n=1 Tax=Cellulomonas fimi TaxID=1708 RepID=A0A7Y0M2L1_CELFI|nr:hypothetical protein [Cellulomonas fimi]NMR21337.1 hypothetical protein [Cellulomonas fimi]
MTVRSMVGRRGAPALLALGALLVASLSACSPQPGAAAVVDGRAIPVAEVQAAAADLSPYLENVSQTTVLTVLVVAPTFERAAADAGLGVSSEQAKDLLDQVTQEAGQAGRAPVRTEEFSEPAVQVARFTLLQQGLQGMPNAAEVMSGVVADMAELDVEVNPRYGELDLASGQITPSSYPWIVGQPAAG